MRCIAVLSALVAVSSAYIKQMDITDLSAYPSDSTILVTGAAGFIGYHLAASLRELNNVVVGIDSFNDYYDVTLKEARAHKLERLGVVMLNVDICDESMLKTLHARYKFDYIGHLAAQAGVRYSVNHPHQYVHSNVDCFVTMLELLRHTPEVPLVYASSSSVYGKGASIPFTEDECSDRPTNVYGATKRMNELLAHAYNHLYGVKATGLRFFTVFGPFGRPDMAPYIFTDRISRGLPIDVYHTANNEEMRRDFTHVDDIVDGFMRAMKHAAPYDVFNIGRGEPVSVPQFIEMVESALQKKADRHDMPAHDAELMVTFANTSHAMRKLGYAPRVATQDGVDNFVAWYDWYSKKLQAGAGFPGKDTYLPANKMPELLTSTPTEQ